MEQLKFLGCNDREATIYLHCLQVGPSSVQDIARKLRQNRITVHSAVEQMQAKGLLFETRKSKRRFIVAEEPVGLLRLFQKKENEMRLARSNLEHAVQLLSTVQGIDHSIPAVKLYEEVDGFKKMLEETLEARGEVLVYSNVDLLSKLVGVQHLEQYFRQRSRKNIHTRLIFPPCDFADLVKAKTRDYKIQVRLLPRDMQWRSGIFAWNESLALMSYTEQKLTCTIIENKDIAYFYRNIIFELCWEQARPMKSA